MSRKVILIPILGVSSLFVLFWLFYFFYLIPIKTETEIKFNQKEKEIILSFKYPVLQDYFLKNFEIVPRTEGNFIFEKSTGLFSFLGTREIRFLPKKIDFDKTYKVKSFENEFTFFLPSPKPREITFDEKKKEIVITFFDSIEKEYFFEKFKMEPYLSGEYIFSDSNKKVIFLPELIEEDKDYQVEILGKSLAFKIESPKTKEIFFDRIKKEIVIIFTKPVEEEYFFENFKVVPYLEGKFIFDKSKTKAIFRPYDIKEGKNYRIEILGKGLSFKIAPPVKPSPQLVSKDKLIEVDLSEQKLRLHQKGKIVGEYRISSGRPGMPTPIGNFKVLSKIRLAWSARYRLYMPYSLRFYNGYYIHELPYWPGGYREGEEHLGIPVSHGCIRLGMGPAERVYNFANIGTKIIIHR